MKERDTLRPKDVRPRGVLRWTGDLPAPGYGRFWPPDALAPWIEHFWFVQWKLDAPETHEVLPHPSVQFVIEAGHSRVAGIAPGRFTRTLEGQGRVLGTKFHPGGFRPWLGRSLAALPAEGLHPRDVFGEDFDALEREIVSTSDAERCLARVADFLVERMPARDDRVDVVRAIVERAATDRDVLRVDDLAAAFDLSVRALQRLFRDEVGASPKWVIQRYRLHEAAERIASGAATSWADFAADLGYADQAHFIRDFKRLVGQTPADYARSLT